MQALRIMYIEWRVDVGKTKSGSVSQVQSDTLKRFNVYIVGFFSGPFMFN